MMRKTTAELLADWAATQNIANIQEKLKAETDAEKYEILARLIRDEFQKFETGPLS